jgi:hypothetical protein
MFRPGIYPPFAPLAAKRAMYFVLWALARLKWSLDTLRLPLNNADWLLYLDIHIISALRLRRFPSLLSPHGFNDQIKWLMLFAQHPDMPQCVDKLRVRDYVEEKIGGQHLIPLTAHSADWEDIAPILATSKGVLKCSHDSGSASFFDQVDPVSLPALRERYEGLLSREYGVGKGEWPYEKATRALLIEERLEGPDEASLPADIKVHCVRGIPKLIHVIADRNTVPQQAFFLTDGTRVFPRVKPARKQIVEFDFETVTAKILPLAGVLAAAFAYVRTDFYLSKGHAYFGEMTFFEEAGLFRDRREDSDLAALLGIECSSPMPSLKSSVRAV